MAFRETLYDYQKLVNPALFLILFVVVLVASGCASNLSPEIASAPDRDISYLEVRQDIDSYAGSGVRWGGLIAAIANNASDTRIEIVQKTLHRSGSPTSGDQSDGRFIAVIGEFVDPAVYSVGREMTVFGSIEGGDAGKIGEYEYRYPVVQVTHYQLWPRPVDRADRNFDPLWRDPWYDPWYGYRSRPWRDPFYHRVRRYPARQEGG